MHARVRYALLLILVALLVAGPLVVPVTASPPGLIADNLIAHWKLGEASGTRLDETNNCGGSGCDLTDNNTVTQATGKIGNAAQFTSANTESLSRADHADLSTGDISFTWALWVYFDSITGERWLVGKTSGTDQREYAIRINAAGSSKIEVSMWSGAANTNLVANSFGNISTATWYFVVMSYNAGADVLSVCVNDVCDTASSVGGPIDTTGTLYLGVESGGGKAFGGRLDSVSFWKRAITGAERTCLYNGGAGLDYSFAACDATPTPTVTQTPTVTLTPTSTSTPTVTLTPTVTDTPTPGPSSTSTDTPTTTVTPTPGPTDTPTLTPTTTPTPLVSSTPTLTVTPTPLYDTDLTLSTGLHVLFSRRWTLGELLVFLAVLLVAAVLIVRLLWEMAKDAR